jgi:hypothetical protein
LQLLTRAIVPHVVPVCYIPVEDVFYTASDIGAKIVPHHRPMLDNRQRQTQQTKNYMRQNAYPFICW